MKEEWHPYKARLESALKRIKKSEICEENKKLLLKYHDFLVVTGLSNCRILKYMSQLRRVAESIGKEFEAVTKDDLMGFVAGLERESYSEWTKSSYKIVIRRFYTWIGGSATHPEKVAWIKVNVRKDRLTLPSSGDIITPEDIKVMIEKTRNLRDRALISTLWESGCRIGELATIRIRNLVFDKHGAVMTVRGKTGMRKVRLVWSVQYLAQWLSTHAHRNDRESYVWINIGPVNKGEHIKYATVRKLLKTLAKESGVLKKVNPHAFRHARATYLASHLTEFQMCQYLGWAQGSDMPRTYVHMSGKQMDQAILQLNGIASSIEDKQELLRPIACHRCELVNPCDNKFCSKCGAILDATEAIRVQQDELVVETTRKESYGMMDKLMKDPEIQELIKSKLLSLGTL
jgi:integrase/recombinase XerD